MLSPWDTLVASLATSDNAGSGNNVTEIERPRVACVTDALVEAWGKTGSKPFKSTSTTSETGFSDNKAESVSCIANCHARTLSVGSFDSSTTTLCDFALDIPDWMVSIQLDTSDAPSYYHNLWTEADGIFYRNGHACGITMAAHKQEVRATKEANKELLEELSGVTKCVELESRTTIACLKEMNASTLVAIQQENGAKLSGLHREHESAISTLKQQHKHIIASLRKEQKFTVDVLLKKHRAEAKNIEKTKNARIASLQDQHHAAVTSLEQRHKSAISELKNDRQSITSSLEREFTSTLSKHQRDFERLLDDKDSTIASARADVDSLRETNARQDHDISSLTTRVQKQTSVNTSFKSELRHHQDALCKTLLELGNANLTISSLKRDIADLKSSKDCAVQKLTTDLEGQFKASIEYLQEEVKTLREANDTNIQQASASSSLALAEKEVQIENFKNELAKKDTEHATAQEALRNDLIDLTFTNNELIAQISALQETNDHNSKAFMEAKADADHNKAAWEEINTLFQKEQETVKNLREEVTDLNQHVDELTVYAEKCQKTMQDAQVELRGLALADMEVKRVRWSNEKQAGHVRRLLAEKVPLDNHNIRLFNENLRLKQRCEDVEQGAAETRAYAEDVSTKTLALLQDTQASGLLSVALLAERTRDEVVDGLAAFLNDFLESCNSNVVAGRALVAENNRLAAAAHAARDTVNTLRDEVVGLKDSLNDGEQALTDARIAEEVVHAALAQRSAELDDVLPIADQVPDLETRVLELEDALNDARTRGAPQIWKSVLDDLKAQLAARRGEIEGLRRHVASFKEAEKKHEDSEKRIKSAEDGQEKMELVAAAVAKRNHALTDELVRVREHAGLPPRNYVAGGAEGDMTKVHMRAVLEKMAVAHGYEICEEDFEFVDGLDEVLRVPVDEKDIPPLDREFTAAERVIGGVLDRIMEVGRSAIDGEGGSDIHHRGINPIPMDEGSDDSSDTETVWEPLDLTTDPEEQKAADERFEASMEKWRNLAEQTRDAVLREEQDIAILEDEAF